MTASHLALTIPRPPPARLDTRRPEARGKFLFAGSQKLWVRGVTYGTFRPDANGHEFHDPEIVERDLSLMAANGINAVRTYTVPPRWFLDAAARRDIRLMVGLPWEQHVAFLDDRGRAQDIEARVRAAVEACAGHPAVLCYAVGNEIPAPIVRWHGRRQIERFIERLYRAAKAADPAGLVTYVNYPTTEYLQLPFLEVFCFNVYLESQDRLEAYLARLHNLVGDRPILMAEIGLDSRRHGVECQAETLRWQVGTSFAAGCAGAFVFGWTDEWHRGGYDIEDWDFGLTTRERQPKLALTAVREAFAAVPFPASSAWPRISVVVCSYNGARTIRDTCEGLARLDYPNYETIVVNDGSRDRTARIAESYGFKVINTENRGLSSARNAGLAAATGQIVAYIDDDAWPDPHWLTYVAWTFMTKPYVGVGGPNIPPPGDGVIAECVANAPGGPIHVLLTDEEAEHIPGCNMAFRKEALEAIGGFDPRFRSAGDDVDVCWRLLDRGGRIGFQPAAMVWHHRRDSVKAYWRQQQGYGRAEALLEQKWPERYNTWGHLSWAGRLYGRGITAALLGRGRVYQGTWGTAPFQALYRPAAGAIDCLVLMPEWYLIIAALVALSALGLLWSPLLWTLPILAGALGVSVIRAWVSASGAAFHGGIRSRRTLLGVRALTALLHLLQPLARLTGRFRQGLTPWRQRSARSMCVPWPRSFVAWRETWRSPAETLEAVERALRAEGAVVRRGGDFDRWDLEVCGGLLGRARLSMAIEEHGAGKQLLRFRSCPRVTPWLWPVMGGLATLALAAGASGAAIACLILAASVTFLPVWGLGECGRAVEGVSAALGSLGADAPAQNQHRPSLVGRSRIRNRRP